MSTGMVKVRPEHIEATWKPMMLWMATSRQWTAPLPIQAFVIEHDDGLVLFDTGQDRASVTDPGYFPGGVVGAMYRRTAQADIPADQTLTAGLERLGYAASDVTTVVISHLHQDHIGGLSEVPQARILIDPAEWATVHAKGAELSGIMARHIEAPGRRWEPVAYDGTGTGLSPFTESFDLFGDGTMVVVRTPGHTPGSLSLVVRRDGWASLALVGDLTYSCELLDRGAIPGAGEKDELRRSSDSVLALQRNLPGLAVLAAHDPSAGAHLARAIAG
ncbi:MAG TPA: N-acyl homoserine lactonase family protein [Phycicoccus elongatus]|nr:N-acyl homoserine lactonase family protein [Phycicoccus elongatus]